jgi:hypothetical protein
MRAATGPGRVIAGRYHLQAPIGRGAMGIVWRGRDELLHRAVAVKEVQVNALAMAVGTQVSYEPALREARAAARLSHPSVVTVFDIVEEQGHPWIVMELVPGRSLDQVIAEDGPLAPQHAAELGSCLLGALAAAHAAGVLHRDVKPGNVLVTAGGRAVLTDFGIATFEEDPSLTQGMVVGTPGFTAPERVRGHGATPASDLWSVGATLYAAVEGRGPFDRVGGAAAISAGVAAEDAPRAPSAGPLGPVIDALLRRDPATRPDAATAATLLTDAGSTAGSGPWPLLSHDWPEARQACDGGADSPTTALPADPGPGGGSAEPSFLDPPVFADLRMPGPGDHADPARDVPGWDTAGRGSADRDVAGRDKPGQDEPGQRGAGQDGQHAGRRGGGLPGFLDPLVAEGQAKPPAGRAPAGRAGPASGASRRGPWSRYWRVVTVSAGIAAIVVAALLGSTIYSRTLTAGSDGGPAGGAQAARPAVAAGRPGASSGPVSGVNAQSGGAGTAGHGSGQSGGISSSGASVAGGTGTGGNTGTRSSGTGSSGTGSPGAGGTGTAGPPPAGYQWHTVAAASLGTTAGFVMAAPDAWQLRTHGQNVFLDPPAGRAEIEISLSPFSYERPVREARDQQATALAADTYPGYRKLAIEPADFRGTAAASWRFSWRPAGPARTTVLAILVTLPTSAGRQPYVLSVSAPSASFAAAKSVFEKALSTFRPLPPG